MIVWNDFRNDARVLKEAETLQSAGYDVTVHALHTPGVTEKKEELSSKVKVVRVTRSIFWRFRRKNSKLYSSNSSNSKNNSRKALYVMYGRFVLKTFSRCLTHLSLLYYLIRSNPEIVHAHDVNTLPTAWLASLITRSLLIYDAHEISTSREGYAGIRKIVGFVEKTFMPRAAGTITTTDIRAKFFAVAYGVPRPLVLQNRPRLTRISQNDSIRRQLGLTKAWPILLYQGGLQQGRGLEKIIDAAAQVEEAYFVFIGGGRLEIFLRNKVNIMKLSERVHFIDTVPLDELPIYTSSADIGLQAIENTCLNHFSTDSNKLFEYIMAGIPVIGSDLPEIRKIIDKYGVGIKFNPSETESLVEGIEKLLSDANFRKRLSLNAAKARSELNWESQEKSLLDLYDNLIN